MGHGHTRAGQGVDNTGVGVEVGQSSLAFRFHPIPKHVEGVLNTSRRFFEAHNTAPTEQPAAVLRELLDALVVQAGDGASSHTAFAKIESHGDNEYTILVEDPDWPFDPYDPSAGPSAEYRLVQILPYRLELNERQHRLKAFVFAP